MREIKIQDYPQMNDRIPKDLLYKVNLKCSKLNIPRRVVTCELFYKWLKNQIVIPQQADWGKI